MIMTNFSFVMRNFFLFFLFLFLNSVLFSQKYSKEEHKALNDSVKLIRGIQPLKAINMLLEIADTQKDFPTPQLTNTYNIIASRAGLSGVVYIIRPQGPK